tara:strand:- start:1354 stop:1536 length:183 start_codon:yes stop_codon:yes gene_type:complete
MASFDKFMKDLEKRQKAKAERLERQKEAETAHSMRERVKLYSEKWQNSVRHLRRGKNEKS